MAASGYTPISLYYSTTASAAPTAGNLVSGELAINITDGKLYYKDNAGAVQLLSTSTTATGTANGVLYLNGSKVATSGSALTFDGTNVGAGTTSPVNYSVYGYGPTIEAFGGRGGSFVTTSSSSTVRGVFSADSSAPVVNLKTVTNHSLAFGINDSEQMRLNSTGLGIGTSSPGFKLQVIGTSQLSLSAAGTQQALQLNNSDTTAGTQAVKLGFSSSGVTKASINAAVYGNDYMTFNVGSDTERMRIDSSGNVGIGTSSPSQKLTVAGGIASTTGISALAASTAFFDFNSGSARFAAVSGSTGTAASILFSQYSSNGSVGRDAMTIDSSGNLGLGVTPSTWDSSIKALQVKGISVAGQDAGSGAWILSNARNNGGTWYYQANGYAQQYEISANNGQHRWSIAASGTAGNAISFTQAMTLDASGRLGIGNTSPDAKISLGGSAGYFINLNDGNVIGVVAQTSGDVLYAGTYNSKSYGFLTGNTERARIDSSGNFGLGVTPSAWASTYNAIQFGYGSSRASALFTNGADDTWLVSNAYFNGTNWIRYAAASATGYEMYGGAHKWYTAGSGTAGSTATFTQAMTLNASGGLSVGTTTDPGANNIGLAAGGKLQYSSTAYMTPEDNVSGARIVTGGIIRFDSGGTTERMRLDGSGNLLVGLTATAAYQDGRLNVVGASASPGMTVTSSGFATQSTLFLWNQATSGNNAFASFLTEGTATERGSITYNRAGGLTAYNTTSDYRAKDISGPVENSGALIDSVPVYMGKMKGATQERPMFIAHETPVYAHTGEKDAVDADGNPVYQQMDASALIPVMWAELQSLRARVAQLEAKGA